MDLASVVAALASVGVRVSGSTPNNNVQVDSSRACPTGLAGPEPSGTINDPGQHFHPSVNTGGRAGEFEQLLPGEVRMCRITPHFVDLVVVPTPDARRTSVRMHILASFLGDDGHVHHHGGLVVELVQQFLPILLLLQLGVESQPAAVPDELARRPEPVPQAATIARLRQQPILPVQEFLIPDLLEVAFPVITTNSSTRLLSFAAAVF